VKGAARTRLRGSPLSETLSGAGGGGGGGGGGGKYINPTLQI